MPIFLPVEMMRLLLLLLTAAITSCRQVPSFSEAACASH